MEHKGDSEQQEERQILTQGREVSSPELGSCLWHFLISSCISGEIYSWNYRTQPHSIKRSLHCSWSLLCSACTQVQYLEKPFHLLNTKLLLVFQSLFQLLLILNLSCCKSWVREFGAVAFCMLLLVSIETFSFYFINVSRFLWNEG